MASSVERDNQLLAVGKQCSHPSCLLVDFLPFKCQHCEESFCQEHFMVSAHACPKYDESKHNRVAPNCPLCNIPVAVRPGQDPNARMEEHFTKECSVMTGKSGKARTMPVCAKGGCKKVLFSPIQCDKCRDQFCPSHRFPADHNCSPVVTPNPKHAVPKLLPNVSAKNMNAKTSNAGTATMGAIKRTMTSVTSASKTLQVTKSQSEPKPATSSSHASPFSKSNRPPSSLPVPPPYTIYIGTTDVTTNDASPTNTAPINPDNTVSIPPVVINYNSFMPRPIFATA